MVNMDLINRKDAVDACFELIDARRKWVSYEGRVEIHGIDAVMCALHDLPAVDPTQPDDSNTLKALDCVSRQAALKALEFTWAGKAAFDAIKALPHAVT